MTPDELDISHGATHALATLALSKAEAADAKIDGHEDLCAERYAHIRTSIADVKDSISMIIKIIGWGGSVLATVLIGLVAFFGARTLANNDSQVIALKGQIEALQATQGAQGIQGVQGVRGERGVKGDPAN